MSNLMTCYKCKTDMWLPDELYQAALRSCGQNGIHFYCAYGHEQYFIEGESEETKLRRERDRLQQQLAEKDDEITRQRGLREDTEKRLSATRCAITRIKNRIGNGVCPCCTRSFVNLARHMAIKHPAYSAKAAE